MSRYEVLDWYGEVVEAMTAVLFNGDEEREHVDANEFDVLAGYCEALRDEINRRNRRRMLDED